MELTILEQKLPVTHEVGTLQFLLTLLYSPEVLIY